VTVRFEAFTECPECGRIDCHFLRPPHAAPSAAELEEHQARRSIVEVLGWGGCLVRQETIGPPPPIDESMHEVIRICTGCGKEWGQR